jgi:hypothetical protein
MIEQKKNIEIDLIDLLVKSIYVLRANFWAIVFFVGLGTAIGVAYFYTSKKVYQSKMIISSQILTVSYTKILFDNANLYLGEGNFHMLASQFHISEKVARSIRSLNVEPLFEDQSDAKESEKLLITAEVLDIQILPEFQQELITYLENNDFAKIRVEQQKNYLRQMLASVDKEIEDMEAFKTRIYKGDFFKDAKGNVMFDPTTVNSKILELTDKKLNYQNSLAIVNSVQVIDGFTKFERQSRPKLTNSVVSGFFAGLGMAALFLTFKAINKLLMKAEMAH